MRYTVGDEVLSDLDAGEVLRYQVFDVRLPSLPDEGALLAETLAEGVGVDVRDGHA